MAGNTALVLGASGIVGLAMVEHLDTLDGWRTVGVSRRPPDVPTKARLLALDLLDAEACRRELGGLADVTHIFFAAYKLGASFAEEIAPNVAMLRNVVEAVEPAATGLRHVQLVQGSKFYGNTFGPYRTPAREEQTPHPAPQFYRPQRDWLIARQQGKAWTWSTLRPHGIWGHATGSQLSMMLATALYATVMKHLGQPLHFPGKPGAYDALYQMTEASHLAKGMLWAATSANARNQDFNMINGDYVRWRWAWPKVAEWFDMPVGEVIRLDLGPFMAAQEDAWAELVARHGLQPCRLSDLAVWQSAATNMFNADWDQLSAMTKAQLAGWSGVNDTYAMFARQFDRLAAERIIPDFPALAGRR